MLPVVIADNGAQTIKLGLSTLPISSHRKIYNAAIRSKGDKQLYIGHEFEKCKDYASLSYRMSFERGYLIDWDVQKAVWDRAFGSEVLSLDFQSTSMLITEPPFNMHNNQEKYDQLIFEEYEFASYLRCPVAATLPYGGLFSYNANSVTPPPYPECFLIVDSGFSFTHVLPVMQGDILWNGVRRIDIGGKLLTNHLSTLVSFRQWNMLDQNYIVNDVKEKCCYVSSSFSRDLERCRPRSDSHKMTLQYVLPDFSRNRHGHVRGQPTPIRPENEVSKKDHSDVSMDIYDDDSKERTPRARLEDRLMQDEPPPSDSDQILFMSNERFSVPELLFKPSDIGLGQSGLPETIAHSILSLPQELRGMFWANIGLIGGNIKFPGFANRLRQELRALAPVEYNVGVYEANDPIIEAYRSAHAFANSEEFPTLTVTREEYNEGGSNACRKKFRRFDWDPIKERVDDAARVARRERDRARYRPDEETDEQSEDEPKKATRRAPVKKEKSMSRPRREISKVK